MIIDAKNIAETHESQAWNVKFDLFSGRQRMKRVTDCTIEHRYNDPARKTDRLEANFRPMV